MSKWLVVLKTVMKRHLVLGSATWKTTCQRAAGLINQGLSHRRVHLGDGRANVASKGILGIAGPFLFHSQRSLLSVLVASFFSVLPPVLLTNMLREI